MNRNLATCAVAVAVLAVAGCSSADSRVDDEPEATTATATSASAASTPELPSPGVAATTASSPPGSTGMRDANHLADTVKNVLGVSLQPESLESSAIAMCAYMDGGATTLDAANMTVETMRGIMSDSNARLLSMTMVLEYCPENAGLGG